MVLQSLLVVFNDMDSLGYGFLFPLWKANGNNLRFFANAAWFVFCMFHTNDSPSIYDLDVNVLHVNQPGFECISEILRDLWVVCEVFLVTLKDALCDDITLDLLPEVGWPMLQVDLAALPADLVFDDLHLKSSLLDLEIVKFVVWGLLP